jgi:hypothetical protein
MVGMFLAGGFSIDLTHHAMHAMGSRLMGFTQELFNDTSGFDPEVEAEMWGQMADVYPSYELFRTVTTTTHRSSARVATISSSSSSRSTCCLTGSRSSKTDRDDDLRSGCALPAARRRFGGVTQNPQPTQTFVGGRVRVGSAPKGRIAWRPARGTS